MHFWQFNLILEHWGDRKRGYGRQVVCIVSQADWSLINKTNQNKHASKDVDQGVFPKAKSYLASACQARKSVAGSNLSGPTWDKTKSNFLFLINELSRNRQFVQPKPLFGSYLQRWKSFYVCQAAVEEEAAWKYCSLCLPPGTNKTDQFTFKEVDVKLSSKESQEISTSPLLLSETTSVVYRPDPTQAKRNPSWLLNPLSPFSVLMHVSADFFTRAMGQCRGWMGGMSFKEITFDTYLTITIAHGYQILYLEAKTKTY